jgi:hypothetical protein
MSNHVLIYALITHSLLLLHIILSISLFVLIGASYWSFHPAIHNISICSDLSIPICQPSVICLTVILPSFINSSHSISSFLHTLCRPPVPLTFIQCISIRAHSLHASSMYPLATHAGIHRAILSPSVKRSFAHCTNKSNIPWCTSRDATEQGVDGRSLRNLLGWNNNKLKQWYAI